MKVYIKRLKLKQCVKELLLILLIVGMAMTTLFTYQCKMQKIESGEMILVDHNGGDR